jgi:hypothetical protein
VRSKISEASSGTLLCDIICAEAPLQPCRKATQSTGKYAPCRTATQSAGKYAPCRTATQNAGKYAPCRTATQSAGNHISLLYGDKKMSSFKIAGFEKSKAPPCHSKSRKYVRQELYRRYMKASHFDL